METTDRPVTNIAAASYPDYSAREIAADATIHVVGITLSVFSFVTLFYMIGGTLPSGLFYALVAYATTVVLLFCMSASYHMTPWPDARAYLRRYDQAAIFLKIAGSYTPVVFMINSTMSYILLAMIWSAALVGAANKVIDGGLLDRYTVIIFLAMGWASVLLVWPMFTVLAPFNAWMIVAGGLTYSIGVVFHQWNGLSYQNAIWHAFVLTASMMHFWAITDAAAAMVR